MPNLDLDQKKKKTMQIKFPCTVLLKYIDGLLENVLYSI